jgi:hypothetical protein
MNPRPKLNAVNAKRMVGDLTSGRTLMWVGVALVIHLVLIGATSVGYIRDKWIDPAGAQARRDAENAGKAGANAVSPATQPTNASPTSRPTAVSSDAAEQRLLEQRKDSKVVKDITEPAKPSEIPKEPSRSGFDLDEKLN